MTSPPAEIQAEAQPSAEVTGAYWVQADAYVGDPEPEVEAEL